MQTNRPHEGNRLIEVVNFTTLPARMQTNRPHEGAQPQLGLMLTEPLTLKELAFWWQIGRDAARISLKHMAGVERLGARYQVPVSRMPPGYWLEKGLVKPAEMPDIAEFRRKM